MPDLVDDDSFAVSFPLWFLVHPKLKSKGFITVMSESSEKGSPFFTDMDLAKRFQSESPELAHYVGANAHPDQLLGVLDMLEAEGYTHITIDHTHRGAMFFPIPEVRHYLVGYRRARS